MGLVRDIQRRQAQLDALSNLVVIALLVVVALLVYLLSSLDIQFPFAGPLSEHIPRVLLAGFTLSVLLYLTDQRRRLREEISQSHQELEDAQAALAATCARLSLAHETACTLGELGVQEGLRMALGRGAETLEADAVAVVTDDIEDAYFSPDIHAEEAERALLHAALQAVGRDAAFYIDSGNGTGGETIAVPLRPRAELRSLLCAWRRDRPFAQDQLDCLAALGRMIELAMDRDDSLEQAEDEIEGTLQVLQQVAEEKQPDFSHHAVIVADLATAIGQKLGIAGMSLRNLRMAGLIHDVGIKKTDAERCSGEISRSDSARLLRDHPMSGARIADAAGLTKDVQTAVLTHHERVDGAGEPQHLAAESIPLAGRILAVAEAFGTMTTQREGNAAMSRDEALTRIQNAAGSAYDTAVVRALVSVLADEQAREESPRESETVAS